MVSKIRQPRTHKKLRSAAVLSSNNWMKLIYAPRYAVLEGRARKYILFVGILQKSAIMDILSTFAQKFACGAEVVGSDITYQLLQEN